MPNHLHALLAFPPKVSMSRTIGEWKKFNAIQLSVRWQDRYFDHRIRNATELDLKAAYIRANPVVKNLCGRPEDWPWAIDGRNI